MSKRYDFVIYRNKFIGYVNDLIWMVGWMVCCSGLRHIPLTTEFYVLPIGLLVAIGYEISRRSQHLRSIQSPSINIKHNLK